MDWYESKYEILECWNSGGCAGLGGSDVTVVPL